EQGVAFITREVRLLRPSERRRLFLVYVTAGVRTMDLHAAFLQNVNLVINPSDVEQLPEALEVSIRHYNDLYRPFNRALEATPISERQQPSCINTSRKAACFCISCRSSGSVRPPVGLMLCVTS